MDRRLDFLNQFLGALGAKSIEWSRIGPDRVQGTVVYDETDPEERQDFFWEVTEAEAPSSEVVLLAAMIRAQSLLSIDKLIVDPDELHRRYCVFSGHIYNKGNFQEILENLEAVEVPMLDNGSIGDAYFIHQ